jgi:hypothetical protein
LLAGLRDEPTLEVDFIRITHGYRACCEVADHQVCAHSSYDIVFGMLLVRIPKYDVIHLFSAAYYSYLLSVMPVILIAKAYGKPVILHYHSGEAEDHLEHWPRTTVPIMRLTDTIVVPSNYLAGVFARFGLQGQVISNIVELGRFRFRDRDPLARFLSSRCSTLCNVCVSEPSDNTKRTRNKSHYCTDGSLRSELERFANDLGLRHTKFSGNSILSDARFVRCRDLCLKPLTRQYTCFDPRMLLRDCLWILTKAWYSYVQTRKPLDGQVWRLRRCQPVRFACLESCSAAGSRSMPGQCFRSPAAVR